MQLYNLIFISLCITTTTTMSAPNSSLLSKIQSNAARDSIDFTILPFYQEALDSITALSTSTPSISNLSFDHATHIDTHTHPIPPWFRLLEPLAAGRTTPSWTISSHLSFMSTHSIKKSVLSVSTPQANAFLSDSDVSSRKKKTVALARLLNEYVAQVVRLFPERFAWMAITPLPFVDDAVAEVKYAVEELGAVGVSVLTNHEGMYPGDETFDSLWEYLEGREGRQVVFIHPTEPVIKLEDGRLVASRPCKFASLIHSVTQNRWRVG
jgi:predicted TIM-barrel fold metal-dependent hydrolase